MNADEFRKRGRQMVDYIADYMTHIRSQRVTPEVEPGYLASLLPETAPKKGEDWQVIMNDVDTAIMPGITHWQHPNFHAYFPAGNSYPSILGDMLSDAIGCIGFSWAASPACTELETLVMDWVGKMIGLPKEFLHTSGEGGGVMQGSASECVLVALLSARHRAIKQLKEKQPCIEEGQLLSKLVGYCSKVAHSCVEKAGMIGFVKMRQLDVDDKYSLRGRVLEDAIEEDKKRGLIPFFVCATLGTTGCCSFDNLSELGEVAKRHRVYIHVDAAYAGNALICPEFQYLKKGVENVDSFSFNTNKWLQVNFDCSLMWVRSVNTLTSALTVDPLYLQHQHGDKAIDLRHWGIPLSRRFRALKLWFVLRTYGIEGLQKRIREHCRLAKLFEAKVLSDQRFEVIGEVTMGLVCFRLHGPNNLTQRLLKMLNDSGKLHMIPAMLNEDYVIRFSLCTEYAIEDDINYAWDVISTAATDLMQDTNQAERIIVPRRQRCDSNKEESTLLDLINYSNEDEFKELDGDKISSNQEIQRAEGIRGPYFKSDSRCYNPQVSRSLSYPAATQKRGKNSTIEKLMGGNKNQSKTKEDEKENMDHTDLDSAKDKRLHKFEKAEISHKKAYLKSKENTSKNEIKSIILSSQKETTDDASQQDKDSDYVGSSDSETDETLGQSDFETAEEFIGKRLPLHCSFDSHSFEDGKDNMQADGIGKFSEVKDMCSKEMSKVIYEKNDEEKDFDESVQEV